MKIVFFGTSSFSAKILEFLLQNSYEVVAVVTRPDRPQGRSLKLQPPPVKLALEAVKAAIPIYQPEKVSTKEFETVLRSFTADLFLVVAFGEIIKSNILDLPHKTCMNIHTSLLPKYRGAAPMQRALMDGCSETGVTFIEMVPKMDAGDVIASAVIPVPLAMTCGELEELILRTTLRLLPDVLADFDTYYANKVPQDCSLVSMAPKLLPEEAEVDWNFTALELHNKIRALSPTPGAWCKIKLGSEQKRLKIKASYPIQNLTGSAGQILSRHQELIVACGAGALSLKEVQLEGKKAMAAIDFLKGLHSSFEFMLSPKP